MYRRIFFFQFVLSAAELWGAPAAAAVGSSASKKLPAAAAAAAAMAKPSASAPLTPEPTPRAFKAPPSSASNSKQRPVSAPATAATPAAPAPPPIEALLSKNGTSQPMYRRFVHPQARAIAGIDLARIQDSPVGKLAVAQMESTGWKKKAVEAGLDFAADVERLVLSSPGEGRKATLSEEAPFVVAMQGRFKIEKMRKSLAARKAQRFLHQGAEVWAVAKSDTSLAIVNSQVMLVGDRQSLRAVLDAENATAATDDPDEDENPVRRRAEELARNYDIWAVSEAAFDGLAGNADLPAGADVMRNVDEFELGISFRQGFASDVSFHGRTPEDTAKLASLLSGFKAMAALAVDTRKQPELGTLLDKLKIGTAGDRAVISVAFTRDEVESAVAAAASRRKSGKTVVAVARPQQPASQLGPVAAVVSSAAPVPAPAPVPVPAPFVVRIYNAEGGTREVPLKR